MVVNSLGIHQLPWGVGRRLTRTMEIEGRQNTHTHCLSPTFIDSYSLNFTCDCLETPLISGLYKHLSFNMYSNILISFFCLVLLNHKQINIKYSIFIVFPVMSNNVTKHLFNKSWKQRSGSSFLFFPLTCHTHLFLRCQCCVQALLLLR